MRTLFTSDLRDFLGAPFAPQTGESVATGFGCYGLVRAIYRRAGVEAPALWTDPPEIGAEDRAAAVLAAFPTYWEAIPAPEPMALVSLPSAFFAGGGHVGVYLADGCVAHATLKTGVIFEPWARIRLRALGCYRLREAR